MRRVQRPLVTKGKVEMNRDSILSIQEDGKDHLATGGDPVLEHLNLIATGGHGEVHKVYFWISRHADYRRCSIFKRKQSLRERL